MKKNITITIKFFSGIDKELSLREYEPGKGLQLHFKGRKRLKNILKDLGLTNISSNTYFRDGQRISLWTKVHDGDEISCLRPSGGG